jgi:PAS domain S-box-containing protein
VDKPVIPARSSDPQPASVPQQTRELQAEIAALRREERRYRDLFDRMTCALAIFDAVDEGHDFVFRDFNQSAERVEKVHRDDVVGKSVTEVFQGARESGLLDAFRRVWETGHSESHPLALYRDQEIVGWRDNTLYKLPSGEVVSVFADANERKWMEDALRESENRYRLLAEQTGLLVYDYDVGTGDIRWSGAIEEITGYTPDEYESVNIARWEEFIHPDDRAGATQELMRAMETLAVYHVEYRFRHRSGGYRHIEDRGCFLSDESGEARRMLGTMRDITVRREMEASLRESEERYRLLASLSFEGIAIHENGRILDANQRLANMLGITVDELAGRGLVGFAAHDSRSAAIHDLVLGLVDTCEATLTRQDGTTFIAHLTTKDTVYRGHRRKFVAVRDVTERRAAEEERMRLATAVEQTAEMVVVMSTDGTVKYVNPAFERMTGYPRDEILGRKPGQIGENADDRDRERDVWNIISRDEVWSGRLAHRRKDGTRFDVEMTVSPVRDESGRTVNYVAVMRDVSEVTRLESQLRQSQKMEAIGTLAGGIAHDFNNTLYAILGFTELAMSKIPKENKAYGCLEHVRRAGTRASELVNQILTFSRQKEQVRESLRFQDVVNDALALLRRTIPSTIEIRSQIDAACRPVHGDRTQLDQVIVNLCTNAYQAMREKGGLLEVELAETEIAREMVDENPNLQPGSYLRLVVRDSGPGMDQAIRERVFEPYFTTKPVREGTGMGLAIVHGVVAAMGGEIRVESEPGQGATFEVLLPVVGEKSAEGRSRAGGAGGLAGTERVLFVDDEEAIIQLGRMSLEAFGYRVTTFTDSVEALAAFREDPGAFDVVVTDETMPQMTGHEMARRMLRLQPELPIILCTGFSETINEERAKEEGIREYILKPVAMDTLAKAIRQVCGA